MSLREAYDVTQSLTDALRRDNPKLRRVDIHIEVASTVPAQREEIHDAADKRVAAINEIVSHADPRARCVDIRFYTADRGQYGVVLHCAFASELPIEVVHQRTEQIEAALRLRLRDLDYVVIQAEPERVAFAALPPSHKPAASTSR